MTLLAPLFVVLLLFIVLCGRIVAAQLDVDAAAGAASRTGSLARAQATGRAGAERTARDTLSTRGVRCDPATVAVTYTAGQPAAVTVTVECRVPLQDLVLLGVPGSRVVESTATSPLDQWRGQPS
jgi:Flp pilus assembly protein TadG